MGFENKTQMTNAKYLNKINRWRRESCNLRNEQDLKETREKQDIINQVRGINVTTETSKYLPNEKLPNVRKPYIIISTHYLLP